MPVHPNAYFETFISVLRKTKRQRTPEVTAQMEYFAKTNDSSNQNLSIYLEAILSLWFYRRVLRQHSSDSQKWFLKVLRKEREAIQSADKKDRTVSKENGN